MPNQGTEKQDELLAERIGWSEMDRNSAKIKKRNLLTAMAFMMPAVSFVVIFLLSPVAFNIYLSFTKWKRFKGFGESAGFDNYIKLSESIFFSTALWNTAAWVVVAIVFPLGLGLAMALFYRGVMFENLFKNIIFLPRVLAPTAVGVLWILLYSPTGTLNGILGFFSSQPVDVGWLFQDNTVTPAIMVTFVWQTVGLVMVLILLGLNAIPKDPLEAAYVDGASRFQSFRDIVLPLLLPTILMVTTLSLLAGFTVFDLLWVMGVSYPSQRTLSLVVYMFFEAFSKNFWGFGAAIAVVIGMVVIAISWLQIWLQSRVDRLTK